MPLVIFTLSSRFRGSRASRLDRRIPSRPPSIAALVVIALFVMFVLWCHSDVVMLTHQGGGLENSRPFAGQAVRHAIRRRPRCRGSAP
eukprot:1299369-Pyramimonas_sp.AAC.1